MTRFRIKLTIIFVVGMLLILSTGVALACDYQPEPMTTVTTWGIK
jgi:hypothetical protein